MLVRLAERNLHTKFGDFNEILFYDGIKDSIALVKGSLMGASNVLCRIHSSCKSAHIFNSVECDCREQMIMAQSMIQQEGKGIIIYLDQEGRGNGHLALMQAARLANEENISQTDAYKKLGYSEDNRNYHQAAKIISDLKIKSIVLLTNNPQKIKVLVEAGISIVNSKPLVVNPEGNQQLKLSYKDKEGRGHNIKY